MIVTAHIKFGLHSAFLDSFFTAEDERLPGESIEDGVLRVRKQLEVAVDRLKKETNHGIDDGPNVQTTPNAPHTIPEPLIINIQHEKIQIAIENATTVEELKKVKEDNPIMTVRLMELHHARFKELAQ